MYNAIVEIYGDLKKNIEIRETKSGKKYGIITVVVKQKVTDGFNSNMVKNKDFTVFIWNQMALETYGPYLKKGQSVLAVGELELIERTVVKEKDVNKKSTTRANTNVIVINIKKDSGICLLEKISDSNLIYSI